MIPNFSEGWSMIWVLVPLLGLALVSKAEEPATPAAAAGGSPAFTLPALPWTQDALEPYISANTMSFHYGKHHQAYLDTAAAARAWATVNKLSGGGTTHDEGSTTGKDLAPARQSAKEGHRQ